VQLSEFINQKVDFLKIDIEGAELSVLKEIQGKLNMVKYIFIEYHSVVNKEQEFDLLLSILKKEGFRVHIKVAYSAKYPFIERPLLVDMDNLIEVYAINERNF
jgi:hypothetical protein